ncbi:magnetosome protein MamC [Halochromatium glycolicum]|nr:magnetosome protein MamC [Halochromatium glycolicum]
MSQYEHPYWYPPAANADLSPSGSPSGSPAVRTVAPSHPNALFEMAKLGTVIGLTGAGAANLHRLQQGEVEAGDAALSTVRTGVASGLATAAATLVASQFRSPTLALAATLVTGTAAMYALNPAAKSKQSILRARDHE